TKKLRAVVVRQPKARENLLDGHRGEVLAHVAGDGEEIVRAELLDVSGKRPPGLDVVAGALDQQKRVDVQAAVRRWRPQRETPGAFGIAPELVVVHVEREAAVTHEPELRRAAAGPVSAVGPIGRQE